MIALVQLFFDAQQLCVSSSFDRSDGHAGSSGLPRPRFLRPTRVDDHRGGIFREGAQVLALLAF